MTPQQLYVRSALVFAALSFIIVMFAPQQTGSSSELPIKANKKR